MAQFKKMAAPESEAKVAAMFNSIAGRYDLLNRTLSAGQDIRWRKHLVKGIPRARNGIMLDIACGTGDVAIAAAKKLDEYDQIIGIDISQNMLNLAKTKAQTINVKPKLSWQLGSAEALPFADNSIDAVTISFGLRNVVNKELALKEFHRVLKSYGRLFILEFFIPRDGSLATLFQFYFHKILPNIGGLMSSRSAYTYLPQSVQSFYSEPQLTELLTYLGLSPVDKKEFLFGAVKLLTYQKTN